MSKSKLIFLWLLFLQVAIAKAQTVNEVRILLGNSVTLSAYAEGNYSYQWYRDGTAIPNANGSTHTTSAAGLYQVAALNQQYCQSDLSDGFRVIVEYSDLEVLKVSELRYVGPQEPFEYRLTVRNRGLNDDTDVRVVDALPTSLQYVGMDGPTVGSAAYSGGIITWEIPLLANGQTADLVVRARARRDGTVTNTATVSGTMPDPDLGNNTSTDSKKIIGQIKIPNVFTPNGDGKNDVFRIDGIELYPQNTLSIFNRWGNEVYRNTDGYKNNWSGEGLNEGTYYYVLKLMSGNGSTQSYTGWVTLLRDK